MPDLATPRVTFVLVPGFWLGAWAWDQVAQRLIDAGHAVEAVTLPGLDSPSTPRAGITLDDHIEFLAGVVGRLPGPIALVAHSGSGAVVYGAIDRLPDRVTWSIYVDSGPLPDGAALAPGLSPDLDELPLPSWEDLEAQGSSTAGLDEQALDRFRARAVPHPAGAARGSLHLRDERRRAVPVTLVTSSYPSEDVKRMASEGAPFFGELVHLDVRYVDLPTGHWPMWSRPDGVADALLQAVASA